MSTPEQIKVIEEQWRTYEEREAMNVDGIRQRMTAAGFTPAEIQALEAADSQGK